MTDDGKLSARDLTLAAKATISELTGHKAESVTGMEWDGEAWEITIDVLELTRVPNTTDVLATYAVKVNDEGRLLGYKRERRFVRGQADGGR
jgi:hypothetical protein